MELILIPFIAAIVAFFAPHKHARTVAVLAATAQLALTIYWLAGFDATSGAFTHTTDYMWVAALGVHFKVGIDGIAMLMLLLTNLCTLLIVLTAWHKDFGSRQSLFYGLLLLMQAALVGVFVSLDGLLFYIFWELALIPIYLICGIWGGNDRIKITLKFFIYTFAGSLLMLLGIIYLYLQTNPRSFSYEALQAVALAPQAANYVIWAFFIAFAIKMPIFPFHTWQPSTYTHAPAQGTMLLSGIMLKMGIYGVIRWLLPLAPEALHQNLPIFMALCIIGIVYASIIAIQQTDLKRLIAYSSIAHVGLIAAGIFALNTDGLQGALLQMLNHALGVVGLFFVVDIIETRLHTRQLNDLGGIAKNNRFFSVLFMIILLGTVAVPLTNGFVGELLLLKAVYNYNIIAAAIAGLTVIFCAVYMLRMYGLAMFGSTNAITQKFNNKLQINEIIVLGIISILILLIGVYPQPFLDLTNVSIIKILESVRAQ